MSASRLFDEIVAEGRRVRRRRWLAVLLAVLVIAGVIVALVALGASDGRAAVDVRSGAPDSGVDVGGGIAFAPSEAAPEDPGRTGPGFGAEPRNPSITAPPLPLGDGDPTATTAPVTVAPPTTAAPNASIDVRVQVPEVLDVGLPATVRVDATVTGGQVCGPIRLNLGGASTTIRAGQARLTPTASGAQAVEVVVAYGTNCAESAHDRRSVPVTVRAMRGPSTGPMFSGVPGPAMVEALAVARDRWDTVADAYQMRLDGPAGTRFVRVTASGTRSAVDEFGSPLRIETVDDRFARVQAAVDRGRAIAVSFASDTGVPVVVDEGADGRGVDTVSWFSAG